MWLFDRQRAHAAWRSAVTLSSCRIFPSHALRRSRRLLATSLLHDLKDAKEEPRIVDVVVIVEPTAVRAALGDLVNSHPPTDDGRHHDVALPDLVQHSDPFVE